jgi:hypothetical protein
MSGANKRPITDVLGCRKQAVDLLKVAEDLVQPENIEHYPGAIASVIRSARPLAEEVIQTFTAHFAAQDGAS